MKEVLVLASGGLDSSIVLALYKNLGYKVHVLYLPYGNLNYTKEVESLLNVTKMLDIPRDRIHEVKLDLKHLNSGCTGGDGNSLYVEMRNLIFASYAISLAESMGIDLVALGFINVPVGYSDTDEQFIFDLNNLSVNSVGIEVVAPLHHLDKVGVYKLGVKFGIKLTDTFSCNVSNDVPCGECLDCLDTKHIIKKAGIKDEDNPFIQRG